MPDPYRLQAAACPPSRPSRWAQTARRIRVPLGFAFAALYLWLARPTGHSILLGGFICLPGILLRAVASGHVQKNTRLTTTGPYAHTRNPLYLGSLVLAAGFAAAARSIWIVAGLVVIFLLIYLPVISAEETFLRAEFPAFEEYARRVPRILPRWRAPQAAEGRFSAGLYWKHREYNALSGTIAILAALAAKLYLFHGAP